MKVTKGWKGRAGWGRTATAAVFAIVVAAVFTTAGAAPVSFERARDVAQKRNHSKSRLKPTTRDHAARGLSQSRQKQGLRKAKAQDVTPFFVFEKETGGFIIVAGDDIALPILGETNSGTFDEATMPPAMIWLLGTFEEQITQAVNDGVTQDGETADLWANESMDGSNVSIGPLLTTAWAQGTPYNGQCPMDGASRSVTGCVATAMAQIIKYHEYPTNGIGSSEAYYTETNNILVPSINYSTANYDFNSMRNTYSGSETDTEKNAVAKLMYHAGVSVKMDYSSDESGAYSSVVRPALVYNFGYDASTKYISSTYIQSDIWKDLVIGQLEYNSPVYYHGSGSAGGHAFIIDGYNESNDMFHLNWGWSGSDNGYFALTALNTSIGQFNNSQGMVINIMPNKGDNAPSVIKVTNFASTVGTTSVSANITARMYYGQDFTGKIGFGVVSGGTVSPVLDSVSFYVNNPYSERVLNDNNEYVVRTYGSNDILRSATITKSFSQDMPVGPLTVQTVTKRGDGPWTPVGETRSITIPTHSVTWHADGGTPAPTQSYVVPGSGGSIAQPAAMTKTGHTFGGWYSNEGLTTPAGFPISNVMANINLYAKWTPNVYNVTYELNGGTQQSGTTWGSYTYGVGLALPTPTKTGHDFGGWYANEGLTGSAVTAISTTDMGVKEYWAKWTPSTYAVTYNLDGGTPQTGTWGNYTYGIGLALPTVPTKAGHDFGGWYDNEGLTGSPITVISATDINNKEYWAKWTPKIYSVTYELNSGTQQSGTAWGSYTYGVGLDLPTVPTKAGHAFDGWYDNSDLDGAPVTAISATDTEAKSFWAKWTPIALSGAVSITGDAEFGQTLTAVTSGLFSAPSIENLGTLAYQWKRGGDDISGATGATYALAQADIGHEITVTVTAANCNGGITSDPTDAVSKASQFAPSAPTMAGRAATSITLTAITGAEYRIGTGEWQDNLQFSGLEPNTVYTFYAKLKETATHYESSASAAVEISTDKAALSGEVSISGTARHGQTLTANTALLSSSPIMSDLGTLAYQWKSGGVNVGTNSETYAIQVSDIGHKITVAVTAEHCNGGVTSDATVTVLKAEQTIIPVAPELDSKTYNSVTLVAVPGYEYSNGGTVWHNSHEFGGLRPSTTYTFYQRVAETPDTEASSASPALDVTTEDPPPDALIGTAAISNMNPRIGDVLSGSLIDGGDDDVGTLTYIWKADGEQIGEGETYTVTAADLGKEITLEITSDVKVVGKATSDETAAVLKALQTTAPAAPTVASKTAISITLAAITGAEYRIGTDGEWQDGTIFSNLTPATSYTFYARFAATATHDASPTSDVSTISTDQPTATAYTVTFDANGGSVSPESAPTGADGKLELASLPTPSRDATSSYTYSFNGWFTAASGGTKVDVGYVFTANTTIYAQWTSTLIGGGSGGGNVTPVVTYTITFNANGGTVSPASGTTNSNGNGRLSSLPTPARVATGTTTYKFEGWYTTSAATGGERVTAGSSGTVFSRNTTIYARWAATVSVVGHDREIPADVDSGAVVLPPLVVVSSEFKAGPNPVARSEGSVKFFRQGKRVDNATLTVYDASGNVVNKVKVVDNALGNQDRRQVGEWDLKDARGYSVSEGTYLVRGVVKTGDGKRERVSVVLGVR